MTPYRPRSLRRARSNGFLVIFLFFFRARFQFGNVFRQNRNAPSLNMSLCSLFIITARRKNGGNAIARYQPRPLPRPPIRRRVDAPPRSTTFSDAIDLTFELSASSRPLITAVAVSPIVQRQRRLVTHLLHSSALPRCFAFYPFTREATTLAHMPRHSPALHRSEQSCSRACSRTRARATHAFARTHTHTRVSAWMRNAR